MVRFTIPSDTEAMAPVYKEVNGGLMTTLKNKFPERIIRVGHCGECPEVESKMQQGTFNNEWDYLCGRTKDNVKSNILRKALHKDCPLEKVKQIITEVEE